MDRISKRLDTLSPAQRELLARRLRNSLHAPPAAEAAAPVEGTSARGMTGGGPARAGGLQFSIFFFSDDGSKTSVDKYRLLFECARYADENGFAAVWTPERHFQDFGGLYPNPSVLSAALAMVTRRIGIRAGSVVLPLHHPLRVAEEWSLVDNLSQGRVGVSFASGWHRDDFVFSPAAHGQRREIMFRHIKTIQRLWAGDAVKFEGVDGSEVEVKILLRPVQPRLPVWVTSSGQKETWVRAGEVGANVLTGVQVEPTTLAGKIRLYRESLARHGHDPQAGQVTAMLHTFIGEDLDAVREMVRPPLVNYFRTFLSQGEHDAAKELGIDLNHIRAGDRDALASFAFERFFNEQSLLGTYDKCAPFLDRLVEAGVNEVACLIDFGLSLDEVTRGLEHLKALRDRYAQSARNRPTGETR